MKKLLITFLIVTAAITISSAGLALAGFGRPVGASSLTHSQPKGPLATMPARMPHVNAEHPEAYSFRSTAAIVRSLGASDGAASAQPQGGGSSAVVVVTATVLPVRTIVVNDRGSVVQAWSNTTDADGTHSLYIVRSGSLAGPIVALTPATWQAARHVYARRPASPGRVA